MTTATPDFVSARETWTVERPLGQGGAGRTWLARAASNGQRAVVKELHLEALEAWKQLELFERELRVLQSLDHPGIPRFLDVVEDPDGHPRAIVQTFVDGETLRQRLDTRGPLDATQFECTLRQCLELLAYLHGHVPPIVHRDLNPRNIMLGKAAPQDPPRAWLIDFGAVRWAQREATELTSVGTFGYMPPEQILGRAVTASDLYALGTTFTELATGLSPADWPTDPNSGAPDSRAVIARLSHLPQRLRDTLTALTRPALTERVASAEAALHLLAHGAPRPATAPPSPPATRNTAIAIYVAAAAILGLGAMFVFTSGRSSESPDPVVTATPPTEQPRAATPPPPTQSPPPLRHDPPPRRPPPEPVTTTTVEGTVKLEVVSEPTGATVRIGTTDLGTTPITIELPYGHHDIVLEHNGHAISRRVNMLRDERLVVKF